MSVITSINVAEAIFAPLFDMNISNREDFQLIEEDVSDGSFVQGWDQCVIHSSAKNFTLKWKGSLILKEYDTLRFFMNFKPDIILSGNAVVNGIEHTLFTGIKGSNAPIEPTSRPMKKPEEIAEVTEFTLSFHNTDSTTDKQQVMFYWAGLLASDREEEIENQLPVYGINSWENFINKDGKPGIKNNVFFSEEQLQKIKSRLKDPYFAPMAEQLKAEAKKWEGFDSEKEIREYLPAEEHLYRYVRVRDRNRKVLEQPIIALAIAGYLFDNKEWSMLAVRMILSAAHTPKWFEGPQGCMEGSTWHHVCFMEDHHLSAISIALGFIGDLITPAGLKVVLDAIEKAWKWVNKTCEEQGYRLFMNQGLVGNRGRIVGAAILHKYGRGYEEFIDKSYKDHTVIVNNYLNNEGHCAEGSPYYQYSFTNAVLLWQVYSHYKGVPIAEIVPERFFASIQYIESTMSSNKDVGYSIPVNCARYIPFDTLLLSFLTVACKWEKGYEYLYNRIRNAGYNEEMFKGMDLLLLMDLLPETFPEVKVDSKNLKVFYQSGLFSYEFKSPLKGKLCFFCERNPLTGHYHEDRGSVVLESNGKTLLLDPGTTSYANIASSFMNKAEYHNVAYPEGLSMKICNPIAQKSACEAGVGCTTKIEMKDFTYPGPKLDYAKEMESGVAFGADLQPLFGEEVLLGRRDGEFNVNPEDGSLILKDKWKFKSKRSLNVNFLSYSPWIISDNRAESIGENNKMVFDFNEMHGLRINLTSDDYMIDSHLNKVYTLRVKTEPAEEIELYSTLVFKI